MIQPVRDLISRGVRDGVLRWAHLPGTSLFEMFIALVERALWLTIAEAITPEAAAEAVANLFLDGARASY